MQITLRRPTPSKEILLAPRLVLGETQTAKSKPSPGQTEGEEEDGK